MKSYYITQFQERGMFFLDNSKGWFRQNWSNVLLVLLLLFVVMRKDIRMEFSMHGGGETATGTPENTFTSDPTGIAEPVAQTTSETTDALGIFNLPELVRNVASKTFLNDAHPEAKPNETSIVLPLVDKTTVTKIANTSIVLNPALMNHPSVDEKAVIKAKGNCRDYIRRFAPVAMAEMRKYGIPASITLAQGLLESDAGASPLTINQQNHFGLKCFSKKCPKGHCQNYSDDSHKDFFLKFSNAWESYRAHSLLLENSRYKALHKLDKKDYQAWANGLQRAGYATDKNYAKKLIKIIEELGLQELDG